MRSPSEFAEDHLPGAANHPVLDDAERARVGTLHAQVSAFAAKRVGAALVARNIADLLDGAFADRPREWAPLVYAHAVRDRLEGRAARRRLPQLPSARDRGTHRAAGTLALPRGLRPHRIGQEPPPARARRLRPAGARPRSPGAAPRLAARRPPGRPAARAEALRQPGAGRARAFRSGTPRVCGIGEPEDRHAAGARRIARRDAPRRVHPDRHAAAAAAPAAQGRVPALPRRLERHYDPSYTRAIGRNFARIADAVVATPAGIADADFRRLAQELDPEARPPLPVQET